MWPSSRSAVKRKTDGARRREAAEIAKELTRLAAPRQRWHALWMAMAICSDYTPVRTRRGATVHAFPWTGKTPCCRARSKRGYVVTDQPLNCTDCMAWLVAALEKRGRKARRATGAARP